MNHNADVRYVQVSIPKSPLAPLTYSVPPPFPELQPGMRVLVPLGARFVTAFVTDTDVEADETLEMRPIADLLDPENLFSESMLKVTQWMADYYLAQWADILKSALPPALDIRPQTMISITRAGENADMLHPLLQILKDKKNLPLKLIYDLFGHAGTFSQIRKLESEGLVEIIAARKSVRRGFNMVEVIKASSPPEKDRERDLYRFLKEAERPVPIEELRQQFGNAATLLRKLETQGLIRRFWLPASAAKFWPALQEVQKPNQAQQKAIDAIRAQVNSFGVFLLHGVTGSGKTEVYLRVAKLILAQKKSVLILVPEIALLPLIARRAEQFLGYKMSVLHSELGERERLEEWQKVRRGEAQIVIGTRSALFAPLRNLGLIVIDEEHDGSFKQGEYPRYHARESAIVRAQIEGCPILLGSATPSLESYYNAGNGKYTYLSLPSRVEGKALPKTKLIDMKEEFRQTGDPIFSRFLLDEISRTLERREQILILQNRRGYAAWFMCRECGNILECPNCSITLTYHKQPNRMICHYCDYSRFVPRSCEKCGSLYLHLFGVGTEKLVESLRSLFPTAKVERFDRDSTRKSGSIARILSRFALHEIDMLVGTQMLAKGHDFPRITLIGVIGADSGIGIPDFRASEKLYQLITQVSGRSGRGSEPGLVVLQTFHPDHYAVRSALEQSYQEFYEKEIRFRRVMHFPPYVALANIIFSGNENAVTLKEARDFAKYLLAFKKESMKLIGPAVAPLARLRGLHRFQILLKSPTRKPLRDTLRRALKEFQAHPKRRTQIAIDVDPYSLT
jgi:primosomal protein N' (replication factor Y) (superfamily II helicase)